jgi:hypothetical protein
MRHPIDPKVDCVFKALLGAESNRDLLIHLLADDPDYAHEFRFRDPHGRVFLDHGGIWLLELSEFTADAVETEQQRSRSGPPRRKPWPRTSG